MNESCSGVHHLELCFSYVPVSYVSVSYDENDFSRTPMTSAWHWHCLSYRHHQNPPGCKQTRGKENIEYKHFHDQNKFVESDMYLICSRKHGSCLKPTFEVQVPVIYKQPNYKITTMQTSTILLILGYTCKQNDDYHCFDPTWSNNYELLH